MSARFLTAILRLLPANFSQSADNPIQVDRLPKNRSRVELDYPVFQDSPEAARRQTATIIFLTALAAPALVWLGNLLSLPYLNGGLYTATLLVAAGFVVFGIFGRWSTLLACIIAAALLPALAILVSDIPFALTAAAIALLGTGVFANSIVRSYLALKTAAPMPRDRALAARKACRRRWISLLQPFRGAEFWPLSFLLIPAAAWLIIEPLPKHGGYGDFFSAAIIFGKIFALGAVWSVAHESLFAPLYGRKPYSVWARIRAFTTALSEWCNYNRLNTQGVGVHEDPSGTCATRRRLLSGVILAWGCVWAGLQLEQRSVLWEKALMEKVIDSTQRQKKDQAPQRKVYDRSNLPPLRQSEIDLVLRLPPPQAQDYVDHRIASENAKEAAAEKVREQEEANRRVGELVLESCKKLGRVAVQVVVPSIWTLAALFGLAFGISARVLAGTSALSGDQPRVRILSTDNWEMLVERVSRSGDPIEQTSVYLGNNSRDDTPVLVPREVFQEHAHVLGDSGSGKTSIGLIPLITQLMRFGDCSIVLVDLKADDQFLFESLRIESERITEINNKKRPRPGPEYPFRWFTTVTGRSSFAFNPLRQSAMPALAPDQRTDIVTAALGLQYGSDYGRKYFGDSNYDVLYYALRENPNVESFAQLEEILAGAGDFPLPQETKKAGAHVQSSVRRLARCRALNACPSQGTPQTVLNHAIDLSQLFSQPQALYIALPPAAGISSTAEIARIFLYSLLAAAQAHPRPRKQVFLIVDEFQRIVSKNVELFLQQARSMGIGCIFSNQSLADLDGAGSDLVSAVRANTRFRQVFGAGNQTDIDDLIHSGGETVYGMRSFTHERGLFDWFVRSVNVAEQRGHRLSINDILLATDAPGRNIANIRRGAGYAQFGGMPFVMDSVHHLKWKAYDDRVKAAWPPQDERTLVATIADAPTEPVRGPPTILSPDVRHDPRRPAAFPETPVESSAEGIGPDYVDNIFAELQQDDEARRAKLKAAQRRRRGPASSPENRE